MMDKKLMLTLVEYANLNGIYEILSILRLRLEEKMKIAWSDNNPDKFKPNVITGTALEDIHNAAEFIKQLTKVINYGK